MSAIGQRANRATLGALRCATELLRVRGAVELADHAHRCAGSWRAVIGALFVGYGKQQAEIAFLTQMVNELVQERDDLWAAHVELRSRLAAVTAEQDTLQARVDAMEALVAELRARGWAA